MLVAEGRLIETDGVYAPSGDLSTLAVPESLTALIASRLDALEPDARALAQDASVLGQRFTVAGLAAVSGLDPQTLSPRLEVLVRRELLAMETDPRSPERNQYGFVQSLIREVTYNTLARRDRKTRHLAAARFFETLETDELAGGLAGQYLAAHANADGPEETAALAAQARVALRAAADRALALGGTAQAFEFLRQALALALDPSDGADLALRAGEAATAAGRHQDGEQLLRQASDQFATAGDQDGSDRALTGLGTALINGSRFTDAIELLEPALADVEDFSARPGLIGAGGQLARALMLQYANFDRAVAAADRVLPAAERANMGSLVADLLVTKGTAMTMGGRGREGLALIQAGGSIAESQGATGVAVRSLINQSGQLGWSSPQEVLRGSQRGLAEARRIGHRAFMLTLLANGVEMAVFLGEWEWAESELGPLLDEELESADRLFAVCMVLAYRALRGRPREELIEEIGRADVSEAAVRAQVDTVMGLDAAVDGRLEDSLAKYRSAQTEVAYATDFLWQLHVGTWLRDTRAIQSTLDQVRGGAYFGQVVDAMTVGGEAAIAALDGRSAEGLALYQRAQAGRRDLGLAFEQALLGIDMVTVLEPTLPEVIEAVAQSRQILTTLGATPFLARLEAAANRAAGSASNNGTTTEPIPVVETEVAAS